MAYDPLVLAATHLDSASLILSEDAAGALVLTRGVLLRLADTLSEASDCNPSEAPVLRVIEAARDLLGAVSDAHSQSLAANGEASK